jgi:excisionase family DNA binding protein
MPQIMTTKELAKYLKLHEITICKYAADGRIPAIRIGRVWRFDKEAIDKWIGEGTAPANEVGSKESGKGMKK